MTVIRLLPPLVITYGQIDHLVDVLTDILSADAEEEKLLEVEAVK
jgi:4-aminobutyrate aminotransferase-like enzyme